MPATLESLGIDRMSVPDRIALAEAIWDSIPDADEPAARELREEIDRRLDAHEANPEAAIPWEEIEAEALA